MSFQKLYLGALLLSWCFISTAMDKLKETNNQKKNNSTSTSPFIKFIFKKNNNNNEIKEAKSPDDSDALYIFNKRLELEKEKTKQKPFQSPQEELEEKI